MAGSDGLFVHPCTCPHSGEKNEGAEAPSTCRRRSDCDTRQSLGNGGYRTRRKSGVLAAPRNYRGEAAGRSLEILGVATRVDCSMAAWAQGYPTPALVIVSTFRVGRTPDNCSWGIA
jgi:hypothetical protein